MIIPNAELVRVVTFNISKNEKYDDLIKSLHTLQENVDTYYEEEDDE